MKELVWHTMTLSVRKGIGVLSLFAGLAFAFPAHAAFTDLIIGNVALPTASSDDTLSTIDSSVWAPLFQGLDDDAYLKSLWQGASVMSDTFGGMTATDASAFDLQTQSSLWSPIFAGLDSPTLFSDVWQREFAGLEK